MYNLRYHIASLVAVFLALAVGLVLGTIVVERGVLGQQRQAIVKSLRDEFKQITDENKSLRDTGQRHETFARDAVPLIVEGRLDGATVLVFADTGPNEGLQAVKDAVGSADGTTVVLTVLAPGFGAEDTKVVDAVAEAADSGETSIAILLADELRRVGQRPVTEALAKAGVLELKGLGPFVAVTGAVVVASEETTDPVAMAAWQRLHREGVPVVGVETSSRDTTIADAASSAGLSAIDHVDTPEGAVSLVWLLARRAEGYFGTREGASGAYPRLAP